MKRKLLITFCFAITSLIVSAQFGIGTKNPNASAQLDVVCKNKGILIPRIALTGLTDDTSITNGNTESLLLYNTSTTADLSPGYYYWTGTSWNRIVTTDDFVNASKKLGLHSGDGAPTATNPATKAAGDMYVDSSTGHVYAYDGTAWVNQTKVVSKDADNLIVGGTDALAFLSKSKIEEAAGTKSGAGAPTATNPATKAAGDMYVDSSTGDVYTYDGTAWVNQTKVVSKDADNLIVGGTDALAYLSKSKIEEIAGTKSGAGAPTTTNPATKAAGDMYVDSSTGDVYTYDGTAWVNQTKVVSKDADNLIVGGTDALAFLSKSKIEEIAGTKSGAGAPTATNPATKAAGDMYVDSSTGDVYAYDGTAWVNQTKVVSKDADNLIVGGTDALAFLSKSKIEEIAGTKSGAGAPTATNPATKAAGEMYVDSSTGDVYTYDGTAWVNQTKVVSKDADNLIVGGTDALAFLSKSKIEEAAGTKSGAGAPTATNPATKAAGDMYVDSSTGDVYTYDGTAWVNQTKVVSKDADNLIVGGTDALAFLSKSKIEEAAGTKSGAGAPTATNPATKAAGDIYVDSSTGDVYTYDGTTWVNQTKVVSKDADNLIVGGTDALAFLSKSKIEEAAGIKSGAGAPTATNPATKAAGDMYVDSSTGDVYAYDGTAWVNQTKVVSKDADNLIVGGTDALAFLSKSKIEEIAGTKSGAGAPTATNPATKAAGEMYVDSSTGDVYAYDGTAWVNQTKVVSKDADNLIVGGTDALAFLSKSKIEEAAGTKSGAGAPTATNPATKAAGDMYVDSSTGDVYTYDGTTWVNQTKVVSKDADNLIIGGTDALAFLSKSKIEEAAGTKSGAGAPTATNPATKAAGDMYVDSSTGDVYTYDGTTWVNQTKVVSKDVDNLIAEGTDALAFLSKSKIEEAAGIKSGAGAPTATNPATKAAGDMYVDSSTGDVYTYDGTNWVNQTKVVSKDVDNLIVGGTDALAFLSKSKIEEAAGTRSGTGAPTATNPATKAAGDIYVDSSTGDVYTYDGTSWVNQTKVVSKDADNLIVGGTDALAFLSKSKIEEAAGLSSGTGAPTATNPATKAAGDMYVDSSTGDVYTYDGTSWVKVDTDDQNLTGATLIGTSLKIEIEDGTSQTVNLSALPITGDLSGTLAASTVEKIQDRTVAATTPSGGQALAWNNTTSQWEPTTIISANLLQVGTGSVITRWSGVGSTGTRAGGEGYNAFLGYQSGNANTTGSRNVTNGYQTLYYNTTGTHNTAIGSSALLYNTTGFYNAAYGSNALRKNSVGGYNVAIGHQALFNNTTGASNTASGSSALTTNTSGSANTANGYFALSGNSTGDYNVASGYFAGRFTKAHTLPAKISNSVFIGAKTETKTDGGTNEIVIGYAAVGNGSNTVTLGNDAISQTILKGNVGIGTTTISDKLHVKGATRLQGPLKDYSGDIGTTGQVLASTGSGTDWIAAPSDPNLLLVGTNSVITRWSGVGSKGTSAGSASGLKNHFIGYRTGNANTTGNDLVTIGHLALFNNTTGKNNIALGFALYSNTTGSDNIAIGRTALNTNVAGLNNVAVGSNSLYRNTGNNNTAIGYSAESNHTTVNNSVFIGSNTRAKENGGTNEIVIGYAATGNGSNTVTLGNNAITQTILKGNVGIGTSTHSDKLHVKGATRLEGALKDDSGDTGTTGQVLASTETGTNWITAPSGPNLLLVGTNSVITRWSGVGSKGTSAGTGTWNHFVGYQSGNANTFGGYNTASGTQALYSNTIGRNNTANGYQTLYSNTTGSYNTASGYRALYSNTTGNSNVASGWEALRSNISGYNNTAIGVYTLYRNTTGKFNSAYGTEALYSNTEGIQNTANGWRALYSNISGYNNTASGARALFNNTTGSFNTACSYEALLANTTGNYNIGIGYKAIGSNTTGSYNNGFGHKALYYLGTGAKNIALGYNAGSQISNGDHLSAVSSSVFIGANTRASATGATNEIVIGDAAVGNGSNTATLGNDAITQTMLKGKVNIKQVLHLTPGTAPASPAKGDIYMDDASSQLKFYDGTNWRSFLLAP